MAAGLTYEKIQSQTLSSTQSAIQFLSISTAYTDLILVWAYKAASTNQPTLRVTVNGNSSGYSTTQLYGNGSTVASTRNTSASFWSIARVSGTPSTTAATATIIMNFPNYSNTSYYKSILARTASTDSGVELDCGVWQNSAAINQIDVDAATSNDFGSGSVITLYGIAAA